MRTYKVIVAPHARDQLTQILAYISEGLLEPAAAERLRNAITDALVSLKTMPERGVLRKVGMFANAGYRQLYVKNRIIVYRVEGDTVYVVSIRYGKSSF